MRIDFTLEDAKAIDHILDDLKNQGQFLLEPESCEASVFARYTAYANHLADSKYVKSSHVKDYGISLYGLSPSGLDFINRGGLTVQFLKEQQKEDIASEIERLTKENLELQNNELKYKDKIRAQESIIRFWQVATAIAGFLGILLAVLGYIL